ncbi:hypothetical protein [Bacillus mycoides]|uniref:hypothetical protein n=1 Tax=Bacillus mycoides TaxID=1405 RepID=UPI003D65B003
MTVVKLVTSDSLQVEAELRDDYVTFIKTEAGAGISVVPVGYKELEHIVSEVKSGTQGDKELRKGFELSFYKDGVTIIRKNQGQNEYVTLSLEQLEMVANAIKEESSTSDEQDELEIVKLEAQKKILEEQIQLMHSKQRELEKKMVEHQQNIERRKYKGKTFSEYFDSISGHYIEDGFNIQIGAAWERTIYITAMNGDFELNIDGRYDDKRSLSLKVSKDSGVRGYYKEYFENEIPKNHQKVYDAMVAIKNKYGKMIEDGTLEPQQATETK